MNNGQAAPTALAVDNTAWIRWLLFVLAGLAMVAIDAWDGRLYYGDLDDRMRALQVRELLEGGNFFDLKLSFVAMPEPYASHYSRIVDLPYFLIGTAGQGLLGPETARELAFTLWPPAMLVIFLTLALSTARKINGGSVEYGPMLVMAALLGLSILEFSPGRIDHHNTQLLAMMIMVAGLVSGTRAGGWASGIAAAISIAIGLECIPYIAAGLGALALAAIFRPGRHHDQLTAAGAAMALTAIPAAFLSLGAGGVMARSCDAIGAPWVSAIIAAGAILAIVPLAWPLPMFRTSLAARLTSLAIPAMAAGAALLLLFSECAGDPYANVQGIARALWFDRIGQEKPLLSVFNGGSVPVAALCGVYSFVTIAGVLHSVREARRGNVAPLILAAVAVASLLFFFMMFRSVRFMAAFVPLFVPAAFALRNRALSGRGTGDRALRRWLAAAALVPVAFIGAAMAMSRGGEKPLSVFDQLSFDDCRGQDISVLLRVEGGRVLAGFATSFRIAEEAPRHKIAAIPLHRAAPGIGRFLTAMTETDTAMRNEALASYDYLAVCARDAGVADMGNAPLFADLVAGRPVAGLLPVETPDDTSFRLYEIDPENLR